MEIQESTTDEDILALTKSATIVVLKVSLNRAASFAETTMVSDSTLET